MENPEEILHSLEEFAKLKPKDIPRELEEYLCFVAKTGDPVYQWSAVKSLFREKLISVITEFYESCPSVEIPPCPNVEMFNYDSMKNFILEKLDTFAAAPFTVQRICELLTTPRKEYNRIDKYMRALEKNILVVSTTEPGNRRSAENGEGIMNGLESEHAAEGNSNNDINVEEMDDTPVWPRVNQSETISFQNSENITIETQTSPPRESTQETFVPESKPNEDASTSSIESVITCRATEQPYVSIEPVPAESCTCPEETTENVSVTITAIPAAVQKRRDSIEPVVATDENACDTETNTKVSDESMKDIDSEQTDLVTPQITEAITSTSLVADTVQENDNLLQIKTETIQLDVGKETKLSSNEEFKKNKTIIPIEAHDIPENKQNILETAVSAPDQVSDLLTENSGDETSSSSSSENTEINSINSQETKKTFIIEASVKTEEIPVVSDINISVTEETEKNTETPSNSLINDEDSLSNKCSESKEESPSIAPDSSPESQSEETVSSNSEELVSSTENSETRVNEETPMEIDLEEDIATSTATSAPKADSDTN